MTDVAFIIGNGPSRKQIKLDGLSKHGKTFGCNLLFKDFQPDYLFAMDPAIVQQIEQSDFPQSRFIPAGPQAQGEYTNSGRKNNAGIVAVHNAIARGFNKQYLIGFDSLFGSTDNVYAGSDGYFEMHSSDVFNRKKYFVDYVRMYPEVEFVLVMPKFVTEVVQAKSTNVRGIFINQFNIEFGTATI